MNLRKIYAIAVALAKSQLRASRSGSSRFSLFRRPISLFVIDAILFLGAAGVGYVFVTFLSIGAPSFTAQATSYLEQAMVIIPAIIPGVVFIAGILFELNTSSKFSASDTVNWLPVDQSDYVLGSAISVSYDYSAAFAAALGLTVIPAIDLGLGLDWAGMAVLSLVSLFVGGVLVEIVRAAVNRVSSAFSGRVRRGAGLIRLVVIVSIIVVFEVFLNPNLLLTHLPNFSSSLFPFGLVPLFWGSFAVEGIIQGQVLAVVVFAPLSVLFAGALVWVAVRVRSRYWSPVPTAVTVTSSEYAPRVSFLARFGLTHAETAIVRKDLKGATRRRELLTFFSVPIVLVVIFTLDFVLGAGGSSSSGAATFDALTDIPILFVPCIFGVMVASISFGQESKAVMVLYTLPISPREILRAKAVFALFFALGATLAASVYFALIAGMGTTRFLEDLMVGSCVAVEEVCIGLGFGASHPDFQERPRPRYVDPFWQLVMILVVAFPVLGVTAIPVLARDILETIPGVSFPVGYLFLAAPIFAATISIIFYRWAARSTERLMAEYRI